MGTDASRAERERELFITLLDLAQPVPALAPLKKLLERLATLTRAGRAYVELFRDGAAEERRFSTSVGCTPEDEASIRAVTSRGIVAAAVATGKTVHTPYALLDERFAGQPSVQQQRLEAVLCVPLSGAQPGVLYLEGQRGNGPFAPEDVAVAELVARFLGPVLDKSALSDEGRPVDPTRPFREKLKLDGIAGKSPALAHVLEQVSLVAKLDITVLLVGASGTGKTQVARAIHDNSPRASGPFVELNCAAIPETLIEAELFGTREGAFTGAKKLPGKVELAEEGTLFLDEVTDIPLVAQGKLLQLLQSRQYFPLGASTQQTANIRIIAATNSSLEDLVAAKKFREDLFYRLSPFSIRMPALAERREDIPALLEALARRIAFEHRLPELPLSLSLRAACESLDWPGNVRQLRGKLEGALIRAAAEGASQVEARHLGLSNGGAAAGPLSFAEATRQFQRDLLARELKATGWDTAEVAKRLDMARSHVYNLIKAFQLEKTKD
ncbi:MAG: sigma-54-dependent Fis family transcriptional regulator [Myxococcota bacterium]